MTDIRRNIRWQNKWISATLSDSDSGKDKLTSAVAQLSLCLSLTDKHSHTHTNTHTLSLSFSFGLIVLATFGKWNQLFCPFYFHPIVGWSIFSHLLRKTQLDHYDDYRCKVRTPFDLGLSFEYCALERRENAAPSKVLSKNVYCGHGGGLSWDRKVTVRILATAHYFLKTYYYMFSWFRNT